MKLTRILNLTSGIALAGALLWQHGAVAQDATAQSPTDLAEGPPAVKR